MLKKSNVISISRKNTKKLPSFKGIIICIVLFSITADTTVTAAAKMLTETSIYSDAELVSLLDEVQQEIADRHIERTATVAAGTYIGGKDIPAGDYLLKKEASDSSGVVWVQAKDDPEDQYPSKLYKYLDKNETATFYITVEEGDTLYTPYPVTLTISAGVMFE